MKKVSRKNLKTMLTVMTERVEVMDMVYSASALELSDAKRERDAALARVVDLLEDIEHKSRENILLKSLLDDVEKATEWADKTFSKDYKIPPVTS